MKAIIAVNALGYIGKDGVLPWNRCTEDLKHFKKLTARDKLLVGFKTAMRLPILEGRTVFRDGDEGNPPVEEMDWCIGGKKTYEKYCHLFTEVHISIIENDATTGDTMFPDLQGLPEDCNIFTYRFKTDAPRNNRWFN